MLVDNLEQISVLSLGAGLVLLVGIWILIRNFRLPENFEEKESFRRELKIALLENRLSQRESDEEETESQDT